MTAPTLEPTLRAVEPAARLVTERHLRKVLNDLHDGGRPVPSSPALPHWVSREDLLIASVLPSEVLEGAGARLLLMTAPDDRLIGHLPVAEQLRVYWRLLFQAAVMAAIDRKLAEGVLSVAGCGARLARLGPAAAREIRFVLESDRFADSAGTDADVYRVFAAIYLDLLSFDPGRVEDTFPSLPDRRQVNAVLAEDVDPVALLARSRPAGAADPEPEPPPDERWLAAESVLGCPIDQPEEPPGSLLARALEADRKGNHVRAAILRTQAARVTEGDERDRATTGARSAVARLVQQLAGVLGWDQETQQEWRQAVGPLLGPAAVGIWPRAARCLYELQKIPGDLGREVYAVDVVEFLRTLGRRPVKRPLPHARDVILLMHLRRAQKQLLRTPLGEPQRLRLDRLLHHEVHRVEHAIRRALTPVLTAALVESGLRPTCRVEEVARDKLVAELLDRVCERGYLRIGDLRDAIARNRLKMPDLAGPGEFFTGDPLLRTDTRLAYDLDGVYRRGEFYLRWIQRFSAVFFGTPLGRLFTLYLALPFGGAFLTLMFAEELRHLGGKAHEFASKILAPKPVAPVAPSAGAADPEPDLITPEEVEFDENTGEVFTFDHERAAELASALATSSSPHTEPHHASALVSWPAIVGFGVFLLLMFHAPPFRRAVFAGVRHLGRAVRFVLIDLPRAVWHFPLVKAIRRSTAVRFVNRYLSGAVICAAMVVTVMWFLGANPWRLLRWGGGVFVMAALLFNTRAGWMLQERAAEQLADWWRVVRVNLLPGLVGWVIDVFRRLANWVEARLYAVDEWLRFRGGDSQGSLVLKAALGLVWFPIAYVTRFAFYLLLEPQVNPVKHFPVVTVGHKVVWPTLPALAEVIGWGPAAVIINGCPGIFGFVAWELKENWRLYRANRPARLRPVMIGSHGESMRGLLRPGFHSGTVPKAFRKLRHADPAATARYHHDLEHVAEGVHRFVERELVALLERSPEWGGVRLDVGEVRFGCQRVVIELRAPALGREPLALAFENVAGRVEATAERLGWFDKLTDRQRAALVDALRGLLDMAAAELIGGRERSPTPVETPLDPASPLAELQNAYEWTRWVDRWEAPAAAKA